MLIYACQTPLLTCAGSAESITLRGTGSISPFIGMLQPGDQLLIGKVWYVKSTEREPKNLTGTITVTILAIESDDSDNQWIKFSEYPDYWFDLRDVKNKQHAFEQKRPYGFGIE